MSTKKTDMELFASAIMEAVNMPPIRSYNHPGNYRVNPAVSIEKNNGISETSPNMAFTTREIIKRFASGIPLKGFLTPTYEADGEPNPDGTYNEATNTFSMEAYARMDHEEKAAFQKSLLDKQRAAEKRLKQKADKEIAARRQKELDDHAQKVLAAELAKRKAGENKGSDEPK